MTRANRMALSLQTRLKRMGRPFGHEGNRTELAVSQGSQNRIQGPGKGSAKAGEQRKQGNMFEDSPEHLDP